MSFWTAMVIIIAIISVTEVIKSKHRNQRRFEKQQQDRLAALPGEDAEARRELQDPRERIKVLERIATDGNTLDASETRRIAEEIEALRDRQDSLS